MSTEMDKSLMALMGIEDGPNDIPQDNQDTGGSFFDLTSDSDSDLDMRPKSPVSKQPAAPAAAHSSSLFERLTQKTSLPTASRPRPDIEPKDHPMAAEDEDEDDLLPPMESILQKPSAPSSSKPKRLTLAERMKTKSGERAPLRVEEPASVDIPTLEYNTLSFRPSLSSLPTFDDATLDSQASQEIRDELRALQEQEGVNANQGSDSDVHSDDEASHGRTAPKTSATLTKREQKKLQDARKREMLEQKKLQEARKKEMLEIQRQKEQLIRNAPLPIQQRVAKKFTLASLLEKARNQPVTDTQPQQEDPTGSTNKPAVISLLDTDSEDEKRVHQQRKRVQQQTFLMNPLSRSMQKMRIDPPMPTTTAPVKSPTKPNGGVRASRSTGQVPSSMSIEEFNKTMRRQLAKNNLRRRLESEADAKKMGIWKSPEEYAAEQVQAEDTLSKETDAGEDGDNEEEDDEDYDPENDGDDAESEGNDKMDLGSADEEEVELAKARKQNAMVDDEAMSGKEGPEAAHEADGDGDEEEDDDDDSEDDDEDEEEETADNMVQRRKPGRRRNVIGDDDDINVVVIHSKEPPKPVDVDEAALSSDLPESDESGQESDILQDSDSEAHQNGILDEDDNTQSSISGALAFLSGNFGTPATQKNQASPIVSSLEATDEAGGSMRSDSMISPSMSVPTASLEQFPPPAQADRNAFDVLQSRMRRLEKREQKQKEAIKGKSAYIEYEAEEEDDEFKGFGGIDYESDIDNDDYDMDDGMLDHGVKLQAQDVAAVRQLHMEQEQAQHDKDISELVHGIAAGNLWKRRNGRMDDLDLLDTDDEEEAERRRRIKKLKVSEKFEKLADNPQTAAFARAFEKNIGDEELMFLQEPVDSDEEEKTIRKLQMRGTMSASVSDIDSDVDGGHDGSEEEDDLMKEVALAAKKKAAQDIVDDGESEGEEDILNTDLRRDRLAKARANPIDDGQERRSSMADRVDEYEATLKSRKMIENLLRGGHDEELEQDPDLSGFQHSFSTLDDRIVDRTSQNDRFSTSDSAFTARGEETLEILQASRRRVARTNSSFTVEERRKMFLSTVSEDSRGANASSRMVKEVNRRKVTFRSGVTVKKTDDHSASLEVESVSVGTETRTQRATPASGSILLSALGGNDF
ncbi:hypothetical protein BGZ73_002788 [Actinomortierella ambigua]|nr:hypothetical protein BGZ73_002788 [Actinomortierella ambigua]